MLDEQVHWNSLVELDKKRTVHQVGREEQDNLNEISEIFFLLTHSYYQFLEVLPNPAIMTYGI